jgi:8-oxo-dGTP pyrophosphatase MutT (NUDIX family)
MKVLSDLDFKKGSHCGFCGTRFTEQKLWPRKCFRCYNDSYSNPLPVSVVIISFDYDEEDTGVVIQQRNIEPKKGQWALTGGYMDLGESWEQTAAREVSEELGLSVKTDRFRLWSVDTPTSGNLLVFSLLHIYNNEINWLRQNFVPNAEVQAIKEIYKPEELAFPTHTQNMKKYFKSIGVE